ncbi:PTS system mannose/fructose/sorbose family transporter subunit IID [Aerococcus loyolae]|uniref:PTS system mannose/fructose/sorbose family transporter subunit IID n=1 Tax=Aerococcus loyolae TaxID=2976809 RepID=A0ABT4BXC1_9LACT|nr:PTS system mannose/fructose/sorbose family transporter subunit IID [Aerococcus loyolae]MCY3024904.1 PTS system mannose/fructose/sorbose family transporter subunit IID [Aerococcus loyolae]MCY3027041.1 PTS system mannose/fructose/sorbose family transporter subunit IID [Aerococcus loyolae]MCY3028624.1 PTS system mannose/fructose/sorbose family transporter subunit IID [Aerococcus loyolae]OAM70576.1 PTS mannose transporter subunit IID [Aerococcus loyolae]
MNTNNRITKRDKKMLKQMFFRSLTVFAPFNYAKQGGSGFAYSIMPFLDEYYVNENDHKEALKRNIIWYNVTQNIGTFVMGLVASMEKENSQSKNFDVDSINAVKASLMGPLSGIGDTLFWGVLRVISAGIAIPFAQQGNPIAPIIFLLAYNIPSLITRWYLGNLGFTMGVKYISQIYESGLMSVLTKSASILGLIMLGAMTGNLVQFQSALKWNLGGDNVIVLQDVLDQIFKGIIPILFTLGCFYLLSKKKMNFTLLIILVIILGMSLSFLKIA